MGVPPLGSTVKHIVKMTYVASVHVLSWEKKKKEQSHKSLIRYIKTKMPITITGMVRTPSECPKQSRDGKRRVEKSLGNGRLKRKQGLRSI